MSQKCKTNSAHQEVKIEDNDNDNSSSNPKVILKVCHVCSICSKSFKFPSVLSRHMKIHTVERPFKCKICSKSFKILVNLKRHSNIHTGVKPSACPICPKTFRDSFVLKTHMRIHSGSGEKPFACSVCPKKFSDVSARKKHVMKSHSGQKTYYSCSIPNCSKTYANLGNLRYHMSMHLGTHTCSICSKKFGWKSLLKIHERGHTQEKSLLADKTYYTCSIPNCSKRFSNSGSLRYHMNMHLGTYLCSFCPKKCGWKSLLKIHEKIHTEEMSGAKNSVEEKA